MFKRRPYLTVICIAQFIIAGYVNFALDQNSVVQSRPAQNRALPLSDYMRTVYKLSQEGAAESDELRQKLLDSNLELAQLAARVAADPKDVESRNKLADAYVKEGLPVSAYRLFSEVQALTGGDFHAELGLARIW